MHKSAKRQKRRRLFLVVFGAQYILVLGLMSWSTYRSDGLGALIVAWSIFTFVFILSGGILLYLIRRENRKKKPN